MPKIYTDKYLGMAKRDHLVKTIKEWQEMADIFTMNAPPGPPVIDPTLPDRVYSIIDRWAGKLIGRKINNIVPGPAEPLEQVVAEVLAEVEL